MYVVEWIGLAYISLRVNTDSGAHLPTQLPQCPGHQSTKDHKAQHQGV
jgi:hypothetical protein